MGDQDNSDMNMVMPKRETNVNEYYEAENFLRALLADICKNKNIDHSDCKVCHGNLTTAGDPCFSLRKELHGNGIKGVSLDIGGTIHHVTF